MKKSAKLLTQMTGNKFLLDANIVIEVFDGNTEIADRLINKIDGLKINTW